MLAETLEQYTQSKQSCERNAVWVGVVIRLDLLHWRICCHVIQNLYLSLPGVVWHAEM